MEKRTVTATLSLLTMVIALLVSPAAAGAVSAQQSQDSTFRIRNYKSKLYLQNSGSISNGVDVSQHPRNTNGYQEWRYVPDGQYDTFEHVKSGLNMGINRGNTQPGAKAVLANGSAAYNQDWLIVTRSGTIVELRNRASGLCLGIYDASTAAGAVAAQFTCDGGTNQGWQMIYVV